MKHTIRKFFLISIIFWIILHVSGNFAQGEGQNNKRIRRPVVAGKFYPANPEELRNKILDYFKDINSLNMQEKIVSILVPHAGYDYSGKIAAMAYKQIEHKKVDTVILMGPSHRVGFSTISVYPKGFYQTPLGLIEVDSDLANKLISANKKIHYFPPAHFWEHSLEVQLPFLQILYPKIKIVPVIMGGQTRENIEIMINVMERILKEETTKRVMLVTTCDYSHYYSYKKAVKLDKVAMEAIQQMNYRKLLSLVEKRKCEMDAFGPVAVTMEVSKRLGANRAYILKYANSGDVTGYKKKVVGYAAILFIRNGSFQSK
ncbi:AmmeMemoRadiSam system protein B [Candidatus Aminicenantes bacterium AC-708-M15]|nr:AmmeMemoRadiSam system protein B [SCandidatus Aminicenantes bacterium Aminicenantia_JdfR_composite]MCP2597356.1 AmmeMemoRadiSam system protein B [Candidatus Aminicenantes bacterium AC-335-G13]MCP2597908.1 AmmeMemoRadiSam system protein B [Candidatus Aminicenantes bacterium AC-335-L06]MCP2604456.1 AmmeMemoRadiSam system protein B [Candidatus Aminicenantes bacterium AC-708-M15]MCP2619441.1 AmmeMemoRadiSam system protein B [Candidatus Aminicenantes bacterium AC-335-K20]MCP2621097.1 AmmeMemoRad